MREILLWTLQRSVGSFSIMCLFCICWVCKVCSGTTGGLKEDDKFNNWVRNETLREVINL